jgi:excisionase family DNA binding protein
MDVPDGQLLTTRDVARRLQVREVTVRRWLRKGELRGIRIGRDWRISPEELERLLKDKGRED